MILFIGAIQKMESIQLNQGIGGLLVKIQMIIIQNFFLANYSDIATKIWKLNISPKIKHFIWKLASRALAVAANLLHRNIKVNHLCTRCCLET